MHLSKNAKETRKSKACSWIERVGVTRRALGRGSAVANPNEKKENFNKTKPPGQIFFLYFDKKKIKNSCLELQTA